MTPDIPLPICPPALDRPYVVVNCAMSADGKIALPDGRQTRISSEDDIAHVHRMRNWADAIVIGIGTLLKDDPKLTVKEKFLCADDHPGRMGPPVRVVVDSQARTPENSLFLNDAAPTIVATSCHREPDYLIPSTVEIVHCGDGDRVDLEKLCEVLFRKGVRTIMVEGGGTLIASFMNAGLIDEFQVVIGNKIIGGIGAPSPVMGAGTAEFSDIIELRINAVIPMDNGIRIHYFVSNSP